MSGVFLQTLRTVELVSMNASWCKYLDQISRKLWQADAFFQATAPRTVK